MPFIIANFRHVADGLQEGQFAIGERQRAASLDDLDPIYRQLLDRPITQGHYPRAARIQWHRFNRSLVYCQPR